MRTMYFIGVDTGASAVHRVFARWAELLGAPGARLVGLDAPPGAPPDVLRRMVERMRADTECAGALVTTHKVGIYEAAADLFTLLNDDARRLGEIGCIVRRPDILRGLAIDTVSCAAPILEITGGDRIRSDVAVFGAGGAGRAIAVYLLREHSPSRVVVTDVDARRLENTRAVARVDVLPASENDRVLASLSPGALVVNATGLGKDVAGSPLTDAARFPVDATAWDLNYRGDLSFLAQARRQGVRTADGWPYFVSGWLNIMAHVFDAALKPELLRLARVVADETARCPL